MGTHRAPGASRAPHRLALLVLLVLAAPPAPLRAQADRPDPDLTATSWHGLPVVAGQLLVRFRDGTPAPAQQADHAALGATPVRQLAPALALVRLGEDADLAGALAAYGSRADVAWAEPDVLHAPLGVPDDPKWPLQWGLAKVGAPAAWDQATGDPSCVVAVIDSGVDLDHPDLDDHYAWGWDALADDPAPSDQDGHGTHCCGIAAAETDNGKGVAGAAPACRFAAYRCGDGSFPTSALVAAIQDATTRGAKVLSMSWGSSFNSSVIRLALQDAAAAGCVLVAAAGNDGTTTPFYPAAHPFVIAVASSAPNDTRSTFSNYGPWVDLAAPGQSIYSTWNTGGYAYLSGTSMACPLVAGAAALLYAGLGGERSPEAAGLVRAALQDGTVDVGNWVVHGRLDLPAAWQALAVAGPPALSAVEPSSAPALGGTLLTLRGTGLLGADAVRVDGQDLTDFSVVDDTTLRLTLPPATALGPVDVAVLEGPVLSGALPLTIEATAPPRLLGPTQIAAGQTLAWSFAADPGATWLLLVSLSPATFPFHGQPLLADFAIVASGALDGAGLGGLAVTWPAGLPAFTLHAQIATVDGVFAGATNVVATEALP